MTYNLITKLEKAVIGSCTCTSKTNHFNFHKENCHYRLFAESIVEIERLDRILRTTPDGHDEPCYYCGELCNSFSSRGGTMPIGIFHKDEPGKMKWHHMGCVMERLDAL